MGKPLDRRPRDPNQLGKLMVDIISGEAGCGGGRSGLGSWRNCGSGEL